MKRLFVWLIDGYRRFVSPRLPPMCRFSPSCSAYGRGAILRHGAIKGLLLTVWRILRCNPFNRGGQYDPVPPRGRWRPAPEPLPEPKNGPASESQSGP